MTPKDDPAKTCPIFNIWCAACWFVGKAREFRCGLGNESCPRGLKKESGDGGIIKA